MCSWVDGWQLDISALKETCEEFGIRTLVEVLKQPEAIARSRSTAPGRHQSPMQLCKLSLAAEIVSRSFLILGTPGQDLHKSMRMNRKGRVLFGHHVLSRARRIQAPASLSLWHLQS